MINRLLDRLKRLEASIGPILFYIALALSFLSPEWFWDSAIPSYLKDTWPIVPQTVRALCGIRLLLMAVRHPRYVVPCALILAVFALCFYQCGDKLLFMTALLAFSARDVSCRTIVRICIVALLLIVITAFVSHSLGTTGDLVKHRFGIVGHSFGTVNPNCLATLGFLLAAQSAWLLQVHDWRLLLAVCWPMSLLLAWLTLSLTIVSVLLGLPFVFYGISHYRLSHRWCYAMPWLGLGLSLLLMFIFGPSMGDNTFQSRFSMAGLAIQQSGLSFFGQDYGHIDWMQAVKAGVEPFCIDNIYLRLLIYYGVVPMVLSLLLLGGSLVRLAQRGDVLLFSLALVMLLAGMMEAFPLKATMNFVLLCAMSRTDTPSHHPVVNTLSDAATVQ